jgi:heptosyltransferase II
VIATEGQPKRILIRGTNWVGDSIIAIPAMRAIRNLYPKAHIALLVRPWVKDIYAEADFVDEILEYDKTGRHKGFSGFLRLISEIKARRFDLAILLQNAFEAALIAWCARIPQRIGYARDGRGVLLTGACAIDPDVRHVHQAHYYLAMLSAAGLLESRLWERKDYELSIDLGIRDRDRAAASSMLREMGVGDGEPIVGINPGAFYGEAKCWFPERFAGVADTLADQYQARIVIFGSATDLRTAELVASKMQRPSIILAGQTTLGELMALLKRCTLLITNDSGPMHLAAALDVPQLAIFGSTSEVATGPLSRTAVVIKHQVDCNPCFLRKCPTDFRCMKGITVERVIEAARTVLEASIG